MDNSLQQLKETIAKELGYKDWQGLKDYFGYHIPESILDIVVKRACDVQKSECTESLKKTLQEIKDEVATARGHKSWDHMHAIVQHAKMNEVIKLACEEQKKACAREIDGGVFYDILGGQANFEIKEYILETKNIAE